MHRKLDPRLIKRVLVIRPDHIGDLMLITPVLRAMKAVCPGVEITACIKPYTDPIARRIPEIDAIMHDRLPRGQYTARQFFDVLRDIRQRQFDMVIHFTTDYPYTFLAWLARIPYRVGDYARVGMRSWLNVDVRQSYRNTTLHEIEHNFALCNIFTVALPEQPMSLRVTDDEVEQFKRHHGVVGAQGPAPLLVIHLGTGGGNKPWLPERYAAVADAIFEKFQIRALLVGSTSEIALGQRFVAAAKHAPVNLIGKTDLSDLPVAIACGTYFMGVDSGPLHMAGALGKPTVAIFPTKMVKAAHWGPWHVPQVIVHEPTRCELRCIPRQCGLTTCLDDLAVVTVVTAFEQLLRKNVPLDPQVQKRERIRRTLGIGLIAETSADRVAQEALAQRLAVEGFDAVVLPGTYSVQKLARDLNQHNLHVLVVPRGLWRWRLMAALTGTHVFIPPLVLSPTLFVKTDQSLTAQVMAAFDQFVVA